MRTRIREIRRARGMTLQDVAERCAPPTTPQTIGRLETGRRTVSIHWLNRIAGALGVEATDLILLPAREDPPLVAVLANDGVRAFGRDAVALAPRAAPGTVAVVVESGTGDYRGGDEIWLSRLTPEAYSSALNRDVLVPRPTGRFVFGRLIGREGNRLQILSLGAGRRQIVVTDPPWIAVAAVLIRAL
ncbi:MAG TPA: helix-turn-helix transcriptional regulator [Allosphingosinicella sp.]|nr:helix-turn-helix transcriptional regulator [Allosphingosinicella sp.]